MKKKRINIESYHFEEELYKMYLKGEYTNHKPKDILLKVLQDELNKNQLNLIEMYYFQHINMVEIGKRLNKSPSTVSRTIKRAKEKIKRIMKYFV